MVNYMSILQGGKVILRRKKLDDAEKDYSWRSDPELARLDATYPLTMNYDRFVKMYQDQLKYPTPGSLQLAIEDLDGTFIGNCMYYDLDSIHKQAELGIVIGDKNFWGNSFGYDAVSAMLCFMFRERGLDKVYLHTLDWNKRAQKSFGRSGFKPVRIVRKLSMDFLLMEVTKEEWPQKEELWLEFRSANGFSSEVIIKEEEQF
ncbi:MAG: GNAT family N-acetyltransferase [SAR202 cluster bacterium]|jgi:RimJ/RimL family protein N-acetyltransferase|nr:GNAT family N-acetyltransferase [Dehalococcoidia bacterium]MQG07439.1 GNAT family N-acetyltransferase [SAR202 cluster bacterium]MQG25648.1 GNAT family N-acetyltransferase [SAR202 cluster bacterium]MQG53294.1 GNAT family N-acetyltransferase [SAR202 cluster bacterium]|tara:strand:- start:1955 stop:2563 length:609 start_codon:yes stop_codon:yes gene_type:complete